MSSSWAKGSTYQWRRTRAAILAANRRENGGRCQISLPGEWVNHKGQTVRCAGEADCVHHVDGKANGDTPGRLVAACTPCNLKVGKPGRAVVRPRRVSSWGLDSA